MKILMICLIVGLSISAAAAPISFPVFTKLGQATILEFDEEPDLIVLGDRQSFHVTKIRGLKLEVDALVAKATSNLFVFFKKQEPRSFALVASEEAEPTGYRKFESLTQALRTKAGTKIKTPVKRDLKIVSTTFDAKKDYLTVDVAVSADSKAALKPRWDSVRLTFNAISLAPMKLWSERQEIQKDSHIRARFVFVKPNVPRTLNGVSLILPLEGEATPMTSRLGGSR